MSTVTTPLDQPTFDYVRKLVLDHSAIALEPTKEYLVQSRLLPLAHQKGLSSLRDLVALLRGKPFGDLHTQVVEAMTTNETSFFRDVHSFEALRNDVLPSLVSARATRKTLNVWSAACSTGQEPYTIAILLAEHFPQLNDWNVQIYGSDLSQQVLDRAAVGEYTQLEVNRGLPATLLIKYFEKQGLHWRVKPEIRRRVRFLPLNLIKPWSLLPTLDIVFLRNVLIYFTPETKRKILAEVRRRLAPDGVLFLGGAETTLGIDNTWERVCHGKTSSYRPLCPPLSDSQNLELRAVHATHINREQLVELVESIWSSMLRLEVVPCEGSAVRNATDLIACVRLTGAFNGSVLLLTTERFARHAASQMLEAPEASITTLDMQDATAELCNMLGGGIKSLLPRPSSLSLPAVVNALQYAVTPSPTELVPRLRFTCEGEPLEVRIVEPCADSYRRSDCSAD